MSISTTMKRHGGLRLAIAVLGLSGVAAGTALAVGIAEPAAVRAPALKLVVRPRVRTVTRGATATYTVRIARRDRALARLRLLTALPRHAKARWSRSSTRGTRVVLRISTKNAPLGTRRLRLQVRAGRRRATALLVLVIRAPRAPGAPAVPAVPAVPGAVVPPPVVPTPAPAPPPPPVDVPQPSDFAISGRLGSALQPGAAASLDLALANPGGTTLTVTGLAVTLAAVTAPRADLSHPCGPEDFVITQFTGDYGFTLAPGATRTLSSLGVPEHAWPSVTMTNRPVNQNGCRGATLRLAYAGAAGTS